MAKCTTTSQPILTVPTLIASQANDVHCKSTFLTPTLGARSPLFHRSPTKSLSKLSPNCLHVRHGKLFNNQLIQDRLIPSRSLTDLKLASHLLSPLSLNKWTKENDVDDCSDSSHRILHFGKSPKNRHHYQQPLSVLNKPKFKIPTKPDRVMAAPGSFTEYGIQSSHWSPSEMLAVALESGIFICNVDECSAVIEVRDNSANKNCPFRFVHWNCQGDALICGKLSGEIQICDISRRPNHVLWHLDPLYPLRSMVLEHDYLLTCGTKGNGVHMYDIRQSGESAVPVIQLETKKNSKQTVSYVNWSPNGHTFACGTESGFIYLWDIRHTLRQLYHHRTHDHNPVRVLNFCPWKPSILISGCGIPEPNLCIQNTATGSILEKIECDAEITGIVFNGQQMATSHYSSPVFPVTSRKRENGSPGSVQLWLFNHDKPSPLVALHYHDEGIISMSMSPKNDQLLTVGVDEIICLWEWNIQKTKSHYQTNRSQLDLNHLMR